MYCSKCGSEVAEGGRFCKACGASLVGERRPSAGGSGSGDEVAAGNAKAAVCPQCGATVTPGRHFCGHCGAPLGPHQQPAAAPTTASATPASGVRVGPAAEVAGSFRCPKCGFPAKAGRAFCAHCGAALAGRGGTPARPPVPQRLVRAPSRPRKPINWRKICLAVGIPAILVGLAVAAWRYWPRELLPPVMTRTVMNRATGGFWVRFNNGAPGRREVVLLTATGLWKMPSGNSLNAGAVNTVILSPDGETFFRRLPYDSFFNWRTKKATALEEPAPPYVTYSTGRTFRNGFTVTRFSDDGALFAAVRDNGSVYLFSTATGKVVHTLREGPTQVTPYNGHSGTCVTSSLAFSRDGKLLATGDTNGDIELWKTSTGDQIKTLQWGAGQPCQSTAPQQFDVNNAVSSVGLSPDGRLLASEDNYGVVRVWQVESGKLLHVLPFHFPMIFRKVEFSPDGRFLVTQGGDIVLIWDPRTGRLIKALSPGTGTFDFAPNGDLLTATVGNGRVTVDEWSLRSRLRLPFFSSSKDVVAQTDGGVQMDFVNAAIGHLGFLERALGNYMGGAGKGSFPSSLLDLSNSGVAPAGMLQNNLFGYQFRYSPGQADASGHITTFDLFCRPLLYNQTGMRSFEVDQAGNSHTTNEDRDASASDGSAGHIVAWSALQVANTAETAARQQAAVLLARARAFFQQRQFQAAIAECNAALNVDPSNQEAAKLKSQIQQTMSILGR